MWACLPCQVRAKNEAGYGPYHDAVSYVALSTPSAPTGLALTVNGDDIDVSWTRPTDTGTGSTDHVLDKYELEITSAASFDGSGLIEKTDTETSHSSTGLALGETYYARIRAVNSVGNSAWSNVHGDVSQLLVRVPSAPQTLVAEYSSDSGSSITTTLRWELPTETGSSLV